MKTMTGKVTAVKREKTATVSVSHMWQHPVYKKLVTRTKNYSCHYEGLSLAEGDMVEIQESRPISKTKHFVITKKVGK